MARKASPEELAMNESAAEELAALTLEGELEKKAPAIDNTGSGDIETDTVKPKPKRGRPSNAERALTDSLEKETPGNAGATENVGNKPGRKPGKKSTPSGEALGKQLVGIHALAAMMLQLPEVQITEQEGVALGTAVVAVCEEYNLSVTGKTGAAIQLLAAAAMIYAPRAFMIKARLDAARAAHEASQSVPVGNIHDFTPRTN